MLSLLFRPKLARALWKLYRALEHVSHVGYDPRSIEVLAGHRNKLAALDCAFWHIEFEPFGEPDPKLPPDLFDYNALEGRPARSWEQATS